MKDDREGVEKKKFILTKLKAISKASERGERFSTFLIIGILTLLTIIVLALWFY